MESIRVLVIDDSADDRFFLARAVAKSGLPVQLFEAEGGAEGIDFLSQSARLGDSLAFPKPDLVLLDLKMPGLSGFDVLAWLRQHPEAAPKRIVVLSGSELDLDVRRTRALGAGTYLIKPPTPEQLRRLLCQELRIAA